MMSQRFVLGVVTSAALAAACGGSSSETPPPLQPDPQGFRYAGAPPRDTSDAGVPSAAAPAAAADDDDKPRPPARATWGAGTKTR